MQSLTLIRSQVFDNGVSPKEIGEGEDNAGNIPQHISYTLLAPFHAHFSPFQFFSRPFFIDIFRAHLLLVFFC